MAVWDPARYLQFADDRSRPFLDLIAQIPTNPSFIVDLGCGPGHLTKHLRAQWPAADILGIDESAAMIDRAISDNFDPRANFDVADVIDWTPHRTFDLMISNAMFQWVPDQFGVIDRLLGHLSDGGAFAIQVPNGHDAPFRKVLAELAATDPFAESLSEVRQLPRLDAEDYLRFFFDRGFRVNAWETTYLHVLDGDDPVFDWISGTGARPYLQALPTHLREEFVTELKRRLAEAYPRHDWGTLMPFRRAFAVATRH
ncbi:methyltransferase domain-containing protein [Gordonia rubripertincta]|nr:methyltransferase domain-containing protein [Gordonia rubripertincta]MBM7276357.1 methyltransferase domain-containing protein [Gordonia rubripertincta]MDG6782180.1 methyltransferase domain-containing protein [Gordonia rubripertincta]NKY65082.1 methyltransferase domain-containing protein [Gordonia rubripertincta]QMU21590.1 methyltransferase domain-containing protein [Gordonia rubripertincta]